MKEELVRNRKLVKLAKHLPKKKNLRHFKKPELLIAAWQKINLAQKHQSRKIVIEKRMAKVLGHFSDAGIPLLSEIWFKAEASPPLKEMIEKKLLELFKGFKPTSRHKVPEWFVQFAIGARPIPTVLEEDFKAVIKKIKQM